MNGAIESRDRPQREIDRLNRDLKSAKYLAKFHGDALIGDPLAPKGLLANLRSSIDDIRRVFTFKNAPQIGKVAGKILAGQGLDMKAGAQLIGSLSNDSNSRQMIIDSQVKAKYDKILHPPLTYLGDAFQYRTADGKFNSALHPHLGQAGAPYAKTVPSKTHPLGALPDPSDIFDRLMARQVKQDSKGQEILGRQSGSGLSSMLVYHATIIIHDIFRTNDKDKNISDSSSYLDLSPLYGYTDEMQRKVRDDKYKLGMLKPDTFAEDRLLRQPPGVCILLVAYCRFHNFAATQLRRINENGRFSVPAKYDGPKLAATARHFVPKENQDEEFRKLLKAFEEAWNKKYKLVYGETSNAIGQKEGPEEENKREQEHDRVYEDFQAKLQSIVDKAVANTDPKELETFSGAYEAAWKKLDDDLFNTARLITCGMYVQISIHDYLRALMGFHQYNTDFTLDPRLNMTEHKNVSRGLGNQVTTEFNLLYRFHCAISIRDERYTETFLRQTSDILDIKRAPGWDPKNMTLPEWFDFMKKSGYAASKTKNEPWEETFGLPMSPFKRNPITKLFDDQSMVEELVAAMKEPICQFGPRNVPRCMKSIELLGITQARKWGIGTLNDFREFFQMARHETFESITQDEDIQNALRDLYEHPDKVELYPGVFCESGADLNLDPGPSDVDSALWAAIFSDAITLVRSDRFYTVDWNTSSLTSWGMKEVTPDSNILKSSVFHRLLQRAFPEWFPYDSIHFFHPFYTAEQNAIFAKDQGYAADFRLDDHLKASEPRKPWKPIYLSTESTIKTVLDDKDDSFVHPARFERRNLPRKIAEVLEPGKTSYVAPAVEGIDGDPVTTVRYFVNLMRDIIKREIVTVDSERPIYQIDITRDFAIPVTTRYVADFLGFGDLVRSEKNLNAPYSENEIYRHITNCQIFLSYNADETKLLKRRQAFRTSMNFLYELTLKSNVLEASRWTLSRWIRQGLRALWSPRRGGDNTMTKLGFEVAQVLLRHERDYERAAAILLLIALDSAYNSVLAFTSVLNWFVNDLYELAKEKSSEPSQKHITRSAAKSQQSDRRVTGISWLEIQDLALKEDAKSIRELEKEVLKVQQRTVKLPIIRRAVGKPTLKDDDGKDISVEDGQTIICDVWRAGEEAISKESNTASKTGTTPETDYLLYRSSFTQKFAHYQPKHIAALGLTSMIKVLAQMKNLRRGHDAQGKLKKFKLDYSYEGYSNFVAPMRMKEIALKALDLKLKKPEDAALAEEVFTDKVLKPETDTYMTPEWDEMVPFPTTWKVRFDGFGVSDYRRQPSDPELSMLQEDKLPDWFPPFYQPQGASHWGGTFGTAPSSKETTPAEKLTTPTKGCGIPAS